ncbi:hypothetical protein AALO_G00046760 [Alosa alosa]|uniref:Uncharacterized protein n=1 Tax=Alosa alosa TaxID=278164 RepID=A0AAV6H9G5_9TELE|nr:hypothetical protein AALO_G00046760 [Alosa alosa]
MGRRRQGGPWALNLGLEVQVKWFGWGVVILIPLRLYRTFHFMSIDECYTYPLLMPNPFLFFKYQKANLVTVDGTELELGNVYGAFLNCELH